MKANNAREVRFPGTNDETASNRQLRCDGGQSNAKTFRQRISERVSEYLENATGPNALPESFDDVADWQSDSEGIEAAKFRFDSEHVHIEYDLDVENCIVGIHSQNGDVSLILDEDGEHWRDVMVDVTPEEADRMAEQLQLAAEFAREEVNADVRT